MDSAAANTSGGTSAIGRASEIQCHCDRSRGEGRDPGTGKNLVFLTNQFALPALTICALYRCRWQVELFFKWIKQHLRIKRFYGTSENAVRTQIWIAISVYVLVAIIEETSSERVPAYVATDLVADALRETAAETSGCWASSQSKPTPHFTGNQISFEF